MKNVLQRVVLLFLYSETRDVQVLVSDDAWHDVAIDNHSVAIGIHAEEHLYLHLEKLLSSNRIVTQSSDNLCIFGEQFLKVMRQGESNARKCPLANGFVS